MDHKVSDDKSTSRLPLVLSLLTAALLVGSYFVFPSFREGVDTAFDLLTSGDEERIREWVSQFGGWGVVVILVSMILQMFMFIIPNVVLIMICILSYGPLWGALLAWVGICLASTVGYYIGNKLSPVIIHRLVSPKTRRNLGEFVESYGMKAVLILRLSTLSNDGLSLVAGLLNMQYRRFIVATMIGITPVITVFALFGHSGKIEKGLLWVGGLLLLSLIIYIIIDKRRKKKKKTTKKKG